MLQCVMMWCYVTLVLVKIILLFTGIQGIYIASVHQPSQTDDTQSDPYVGLVKQALKKLEN